MSYLTPQVRMKETGNIYAMKVMNKSQIMESGCLHRVTPRRRQYEHTLAERRIMEGISHLFLVWWVSKRRVTV